MKDGTARPARTVKAGCGIRYAPEELEESPGFDFSAARALLENLDDPDNSDPEAESQELKQAQGADSTGQEKDPAGTAGQSTE